MFVARRKQQQVGTMLEELGMEVVEERLQGALSRPATPEFRLSHLIQVPYPALHVAVLVLVPKLSLL